VDVGNPAFQRLVENLNLSQLDDGRILLGYDVNYRRAVYFKESSDDGVTWGDEATELYSAQFPVNSLTVINSTPENLLAVFEINPGYSSGIYKLVSTNHGFTWSDTIKIVNSELNETRPKIVKRSDSSLLLTYLRYEPTQIQDYNQYDIYYLISSDGGETWSEKKRFTKYVGNDEFINISHLNGKTFISFASQRFTNNFQISYGILEETIEYYTPPYVFDSGIIYHSEIVPTNFTFRATIIDDDQVGNVDLEIEDMLISGSLYDDGMHDDFEADDNVWGNIFTFISPRNTDTYEMNANKISLPFNNKGVLAGVRYNTQVAALINSSDIDNNANTIKTFNPFSTLSSAKFEEGTFLFSGGFWLSGYSDGELWANAVASASLVEDYLPGLVGGNPENSLNNIYVVNKDDEPFGSSWNKWNDAVELGAEFYDGDKDGIYNPIDKNWNGSWDPNEDMPALIGDEIAWCVYNDGLPGAQRRWDTVEPQGIEIRQSVFASSLPDLENVICLKYKILNTGSVAEKMESVYFGIWEDGDLGNHVEDVVGCDTLYNSAYYYNNRPDEVYGENCPAFFTSVLQGPIYCTCETSDTARINYGTLIGSDIISGSKNLDMSSHVFFIGGDANLDDPGTKEQARNYLLGKDRLGIIPNPRWFPYCDVRGDVNPSDVNPLFWASGDPVTDVGWITGLNSDYRNLFSTGPFKLEKHKSQEIIIAYVIGRGTDYFNSITVARENVQRVIQEYKSNFASMTYSPPPPTNPVTDYVLYHNYPNPFNPTTTIRYEIPQDGMVTIKVYDILGQEVRTVLNEFKQADRYETNFNATGLASGVYIYRMKVNDFITSKKMLLLR
jgi:hypothetical protein